MKTASPQGLNETHNSARMCVTVEPEVLEKAKAFARLSGFSFSFSAYVNDVLKREIQQRTLAMSVPRV